MSGRNVAMQTCCLCAALRRAPPIEKRLQNDAQRQPRVVALVSPGLVKLPAPSRSQPHRGDEEKRSVAVGAAAAAPVAAAAAAAPGTQILIGLATAYALPFFGLMLLAPQWERTQQLLGSMALFVPLAAVYIYLLTMSWQPDTLQLMMPGNVKDGMAGKPQFFPKLESISVLFGRLTTAASVWVHILTINLFVAKYCYFKGLALKIPTFHTILIATFFGPLAILSSAITQSVCGRPESKESSDPSDPSAILSPSGNPEGKPETAQSDSASNVVASIPAAVVEGPNGSTPKEASDATKEASNSPSAETVSTSGGKKPGANRVDPVASPQEPEEASLPSSDAPSSPGAVDEVSGREATKVESGVSSMGSNGTIAKKEEAARLAKEEAARLAKEEAARLAKEKEEEAARLAREKEEAARLAKLEAARLAKEEAARLEREAQETKSRLEREAQETKSRLAREAQETKRRLEREAQESKSRLEKGAKGSSTSAADVIRETVAEEKSKKKDSRRLFSKLFGSQDEEEDVEVIRQEGGNVVLKHDGGNIILEPYSDRKLKE